MGLSEEEQNKSYELRQNLNGETNVGNKTEELTQTHKSEMHTAACQSQPEEMGCCQENGNSHCCGNPAFPEKLETQDANVSTAKVISDKKSTKKLNSRINSVKGGSARKVCAMPTWFDSWEQEDMYAALAVVCAAASVAIAYSCYKKL